MCILHYVFIIVYHSRSVIVLILYKVHRICNGMMCFSLLFTPIYFEVLFTIDSMCDAI